MAVACAQCGEANPERARFCLACGQALATGRVVASGTRKTVTVVFVDLVDSTPLGERLDAEPFRLVLGRYYDKARRLLSDHGRTVQKFRPARALQRSTRWWATTSPRLTGCGRSGDDLGIAKALRMLAHAYFSMGQSVKAQKAVEQAIDAAKRAGDERWEARIVRLYCLISRLPEWPSGPVEVVGDGQLADTLRARLGLGSATDRGPAPRPAVIIDTSGSPEWIKQALRRLDDLGTLVLTRAVGGDVSLNLYDDLHFRSLTIMGVMATSS
jgi:hypothetical protein